MAYVYRFKDSEDKIIYIGKTINIDKRIHDHFTRGHLSSSCYDSVAIIEYMKVNTEADSLLLEQYLINKYHPRYNKQGKVDSSPTIALGAEESWRVYKRLTPKIKPFTEANNEPIPKWKLIVFEVGMWILIIYMILNLIF